MKHWVIENNPRHGRISISLRCIEEEGGWDRVLGIHAEDGGIVFREECDSYFSTYRSYQEAIEALEEAIAWIKDRGL